MTHVGLRYWIGVGGGSAETRFTDLNQRLHAANLCIAGAISIDLERHVIDLCRR